MVFFPTTGRFESATREWLLPIHGWVYTPERSTRMRRATLALFRRYLRYKTREALTPLFQERTRAFFVGGHRGQNVDVRFGEEKFPLLSGANGHVRGVIRLHEDRIARLAAEGTASPGWLEFQGVSEGGIESAAPGRVQLLPPVGLSVVSDIDDTIKHTHVRHRGELLANTFLRDFRAIPAAAEIYREWADLGATFHYVSSSPWQLFDPLTEFFRREGFPDGSFHLRLLRLGDSRPFKIFVGRPVYKAAAIETILRAYPERRFVFVGDSGERDPEIYGAVARKHPQQVLRILIRDVTGHPATSERYKKAFRWLPRNQAHIFRNLEELREESRHWGAYLGAESRSTENAQS